MTAWAHVGVALGAGALLVDLGNRLFGSYARTPSGVLWRVALLTALVLLLLAPAVWSWAHPVDLSARRSLFVAGICGSIIFLHFLFPYRWGIERVVDPATKLTPLVDGIALREVTVALDCLPSSADGLSCLVLTDLHVNKERDFELLTGAIDRLCATPVDLVFLLGDFGEKCERLPDIISACARLPARHGSFCVLGNHDYEGGRAAMLKEQLAQHSIPVLENENTELKALGITLVGLATPWIRKELPSPPTGKCNLCLTHTPDNLLSFPRLNVAFGVAGHTHGGKIKLPGLGVILIASALGRFLTEGWFRYRGRLLHLSRGIGYFPGRLGNHGEISRLTLRRKIGASD